MSMAIITFKGNPTTTVGSLPKVGAAAPDFQATDNELNDLALNTYFGRKIILTIFPSLDTGTCAKSMRRCNELAQQFPDVLILGISQDLPFAQHSFCLQEGLKNVLPLSTFRHPEFGQSYGVLITDGPLMGLLARAIVVINEQAKIMYTEM